MNTKTNNQQLKLIEHLENFRNACQNSQPSEEDLHALETILQSVPESSRYSALTTVRDEENGTILHVAMQRRYTQVVHCLVKHISQQQWNRLNSFGNKYGRTVLTYSVKNRQAQKAVLGPLTSAQRFSLLTRQDNYGRTVVHQAVIENDADCVRNLSEFLSDVDWARLLCKKAKGKTAVYYAVETFKLGLLRVLRESLPPKHWSEILMEQDGEGKTLLHYAATLTPSEPTPQEMSATKNSLMEVLVHAVPSDDLYDVVKVKDHFGNLALHADFECARSLINLLSAECCGKLLGMADRKGLTLMHVVATKGDSKMMKFLLDLCSPQDSLKLIKMVDNAGNNVLHLACSEACSNDVVELLMKVVPENEAYGCLKVSNRSKCTPMHSAALCAFPSFAILLDTLSTSEVNELAELQDDEGCTILHRAAWNTDGRSVDKLMSRLEPENLYCLAKMPDNQGATSVHCAAGFGQVDALSAIFRHLTPQQVQALLWTCDGKSMFPIHHAALSRSVDTFEFLLETLSSKHERQQILKTGDSCHLTPLDHAIAENDWAIFKLITREFFPEEQASFNEREKEKTAHTRKMIQELEDSLNVCKRRTKALEILVAEKTNETSSLQDYIAKLTDKAAEPEIHLAKKTHVNEGGTENAPTVSTAEQAQLLPVKRRMSEEEKATETTFMPAPLKKGKLMKGEIEDEMDVAMPSSGQVKDTEKREKRSYREVLQLRGDSLASDVQSNTAATSSSTNMSKTQFMNPGSVEGALVMKGDKAAECPVGEKEVVEKETLTTVAGNSQSGSSSDSDGTEEVSIPTELERLIDELCGKHEITDYMLLQNPGNLRKVVILGRNTDRITAGQLSELIKSDDQFKRFSVTVSKRKDLLYSKQFMQVAHYLYDREIRCELLIQAQSIAGGENLYYILGCAHTMFSHHRNAELQDRNADLEGLRQEFRQQVPPRYALFHFGNRREDQEAGDPEALLQYSNTPPLIGYRYYYQSDIPAAGARATGQQMQPEDETEKVDPKHCMNDLFLLKFDQNRVNDYHLRLAQRRPPNVGPLVRIENRNELKQYIQPRGLQYNIWVKDMLGVLCSHTALDVQRRRGLGYHLLFKLNDGQGALDVGDSGSIVYLERNGQYQPFGMFVAQLKDVFDDDEVYYQAVILCLAFKDIEHAYRDIVNNINPL